MNYCKTRERRRIYLNEQLISILNQVNKVRSIRHKCVFTRKNGNPVRSIKKAFKLACKRAEIRGFVFHDLRHTFNTNMRKAGVDRTVIMNITGHKTGEMFLRYNTVDEDDVRDAMDQFGSFLEMHNKKDPENSGTKVEHSNFLGLKLKRKDFTDP